MRRRLIVCCAEIVVTVVVLIFTCIRLAGATEPVKFDFQSSLIDAYNLGLSGVMTMGDQITPDPNHPNGFKVDLLVNFELTYSHWTFRHLPDGNYAVQALVPPEWYLEKVREGSGLSMEVVRPLLGVAGRFTGWLDGPAARPEGTPPVPEPQAITIQGRLVAVTLDGWKLLLEATMPGGKWELNVIAFEKAIP